MKLKPKNDDEYSYWNNMVNFFENTIPNYFKAISGDDDPWRGLLIWFKPVFTFFDEFTPLRFVFVICVAIIISGIVAKIAGKDLSEPIATITLNKEVDKVREKLKGAEAKITKAKKKFGRARLKTKEYEIYKEETVLIYSWPPASTNIKKMFVTNRQLKGTISANRKDGKSRIRISRRGSVYYWKFNTREERDHVLHIMLKAKEALLQ